MPLIIIAVCLILYGIFALFSVSIYESFTTTLSLISRGIMHGDSSNYFYFFKQLTNLVWAGAAGCIVYIFPLKTFKKDKFLTFICIMTVIFQLLVFTPLGAGEDGTGFNGARGWLNIPGIPSIQPAEFFKVGYVIFIARWFVRKRHLLSSFDIIKKYFVVNLVIFFIFILIPDLGSVLVMGITGMIMCRYAGVSHQNIFKMMTVGGILSSLGLIALFGFNNTFCVGPRSETQTKPIYCKFTYITKRLSAYTDSNKIENSKDADWQNTQALIAIGGGGRIGRGYGKGLQKFGYIPEAQSDFIFAAFAEESGFLGTVILLSLYGALARYTLKKIPEQRDEYFKIISIGLISLIIVQMFVNIGVNTKILPNTGLTLPFISYGGTALMTNVIMIVLLYKILYKKDS